MRRLVTITILSTACLAGAFAQSTAGNTIAGLGYLYPVPVSVAPGQLITVFVAGSLQGTVTATVQQVSQLPAPVLEVHPAPPCVIAPDSAPCSTFTAVTIQIPYAVVPTCLNCALPASLYTQLFINVNGVAGPSFPLTPYTDHVHILTACDTAVPNTSGYPAYNGFPCQPLVTHANGSLVTAASPAQGLEEVIAYAVGLGATNPAVATGQAASGPTPTSQVFTLDFNYRPNALATLPIKPAAVPLGVVPSDFLFPVYSGLAPGYVGLYQMNIIVAQPPQGLLACSGAIQSNLTISVGGLTSFDGAAICVAPPQ